MPYVAFEAVHKLVTADEAQTSWIGIALVSSSAIGMPFLGIAKRRLADKLGSVATRGEGTQNLLCAYLAAAVLVGLLGDALFGLWWLDPWPRSSWPQSRSEKAARAGAARAAAPAANRARLTASNEPPSSRRRRSSA